VAIYRVARRSNGRLPQFEEKAPLDAEDVFEQLRGTSPFQYGDVSRRRLGRVRATGRLGRAKTLTNDLVVLSIIPRNVAGSVSAVVPHSEYHQIRGAKSEQDVTLEGEISFMDSNDTHELFLSDAKVSV
jgi:hypothetical protein